MPAEDGVAFLLFAMDEEQDRLIYDRWLIAGQFEMGFYEFKQKLMAPKDFDDEKVLNDIADMMATLEGTNGTV